MGMTNQPDDQRALTLTGETVETVLGALDVAAADPRASYQSRFLCGQAATAIRSAEMADDGDRVPLSHYSRALDEIHALRTALAYEARGVEAHLEYKTFPKSRRRIAEEQIGRMRRAASGKVEVAYAGQNSNTLRRVLESAAGTALLTRARWEEQQAVYLGTRR